MVLLFFSPGFAALFGSCTRRASGTCIDNFFSNIDGVYKVNEISIADHQGIDALVKCRVEKNRSTYTYRQMKEQNWIQFNHLMHNITVSGDTLNKKWECLLDKTKEAVESSFPIKTGKRKFLFTMSQGLQKSRDKKNRLLKQYKQGRISKELVHWYYLQEKTKNLNLLFL